MKFLLKTTTLLSLFLAMSSGAFYAQSVDLIASVDQTPPFNNGQTFTYSIMSTGNPYNSIRIKLEFDSSVIQLNSLTPIYAFDFTPVNDTATPGLVKYEATSLTGNINTDETIFNIEFEVLDNSQTISIAHNFDPVDGTVVVNSGGNDILGTANDILLETLSSENSEINNGVSISPNPANSEVVININNKELQITNIAFYTIEGKMVFNKIIPDQSLNSPNIRVDTSILKNALYFVNLTDYRGNKHIYKLLIAH